MTKKWGKTSLSSGLLLAAALIPGLACDESTPDTAEDPTENEFGVLLEGLGTNIGDCTNAGAAYSDATDTLTLNLLTTEDAVVSVVSNNLRVNGHQCMSATGGTALTASLVTKLIIKGAAGATTHKVVLDLLPGSFGGLIGTTGGITVDVNGSTGLSFGVRGTDLANVVKMAELTAGGSYFVELSGNTAADVKLVGQPSSIIFALGGAADTFNAQDLTTGLTFLGVATGAINGVTNRPLTVYGGVGADTLKGGLGADTLDGGDDNDLFQTDILGNDGADIYIGGPGLDTVDYSARTAAVTVDVGTAFPSHKGLTLLGKSIAAADTFGITVAAVLNTITFGATSATPDLILAEINADLTGAEAYVDDRGFLVVEASSDVALAITTDSTTTLFGATPSKLAGAIGDADDGKAGETDDVRSDVENIEGGVGDDVLTGSVLANVIDGNAGADTIAGGPGGTCTPAADTDTLNGGAGNDTFLMGVGTNCADVVDGGTETDTANYEHRLTALTITLDGIANDGLLTTELDNIKTTVEVVLGGEGIDTITGGAANEKLYGGLGNDILKGGAGDDTLIGGPGDDNLQGDAGDDTFDEASDGTLLTKVYVKTLTAWEGQDTIHGGVGVNVCDFRQSGSIASTYTLCFSATTANCTAAFNDGSTASATDRNDLTNCTWVKLGDGIDNVTGSVDDDTVEGGGGDDIINGGTGDDTLYGELGNDAIAGEAGNDALYAGPTQVANVIGGVGDSDLCLPRVDLTCEI